MIGYFVSVLRVTNVLLLSMLTDISIKYVFISFMIKKESVQTLYNFWISQTFDDKKKQTIILQ